MIKQKLIEKYAKKFADTQDRITQGVHYAADGSVVMTNRQYLLCIRNAHDLGSPVTLHAKTGLPLQGEYPKVSRIFPTSFDNMAPIKFDELNHVIFRTRCAADVASRIDKKHPTVMLTATNGAAYLQIRNEEHQLEFSAFFGNTQKTEPSKRTLNAEYLHTALSVFGDAASPAVYVKFRGPLEPIVLTDEQDIEVLILPYRMPQ
jgi:hypothetical protein